MFHLRVFVNSKLSDYINVMEKSRQSIHYDRGADIYPEHETDRVKKQRSQSRELLLSDPGLCIGETHISYMNIALENRKEHVPEMISRFWCYIGEKQPLIDSLVTRDLKNIFLDSEKDARIKTNIEELSKFLEENVGARLYCFFA